MVNNQKYHHKDNKLSLDAIAEKWVALVFTHLKTKNQSNKSIKSIIKNNGQ